MLLRGCWRLGRPLICLRGGLQAPAQSGRRSLVSCIDRKSLPRCAGRECSGLRARRAHCHPWLVVGRHRGHHPKAHLPSPKSASLAGGSPIPSTWLASLGRPHSLLFPSVAPLALVYYSSTLSPPWSGSRASEFVLQAFCLSPVFPPAYFTGAL